MKFIYLILGSSISFISLFIIGGLAAIIVYDHPADLPQTKLLFIKIILFLLMTLSNYYLITQITTQKTKSYISLLFSFIVALVVAFQSISIGVYISFGDYLRDIHGINWYSMDYGGWAITIGFFTTSLYSAILLFIMTHILVIKSHYNKRK